MSTGGRCRATRESRAPVPADKERLPLQMTRSNRGADISLFPALFLTFRSLLMYQAQIPLCVTASGASGSSCFWGKDIQ